MWTRRTVVGTISMAAALAGCLGDDENDGEANDENDEDDEDDEPGYDTRLDELDEYDPIDRTGESEVEIEISPGRDPPFDPDPVMVDEMTSITWRWGNSDGEIYPVEVPDPCQWSGSDGGTSHTWQFPFEGKHEIGYTAPDVEEVTGVVFVVNPDG